MRIINKYMILDRTSDTEFVLVDHTDDISKAVSMIKGNQIIMSPTAWKTEITDITNTEDDV